MQYVVIVALVQKFNHIYKQTSSFLSLLRYYLGFSVSH